MLIMKKDPTSSSLSVNLIIVTDCGFEIILCRRHGTRTQITTKTARGSDSEASHHVLQWALTLNSEQGSPR